MVIGVFTSRGNLKGNCGLISATPVFGDKVNYHLGLVQPDTQCIYRDSLLGNRDG